jgi:excisionase family DNA binding protein
MVQKTECLTFTLSEAAKLAGISKSSAYTLARAGRFPGALRLGDKRFIVSRYQFERWLNGANMQNSNPEN